MRVTPNTCPCALEVDYDPARPGEYQLVEVQGRCADHQAIADDQMLDLLFGPTGECRTHTSLMNVVLSPEIGLAETTESGQVALPDEVQLDYWFEGEAPNRVLKYGLVGPTVDSKKLGEVVAAVEAIVPADAIGVVDVAGVLDAAAEPGP